MTCMLLLQPEFALAADGVDSIQLAYAAELTVIDNPITDAFRMVSAAALVRSKQWECAIRQYESVLRRQPRNVKAMLGIANIRRWQGNILLAQAAYERVRVVEPGNSEGLLGLAATYALDHDYEHADEYYSLAEKLLPGDSGVQHAAYDFRRQRNPRMYLFGENDLSFETRVAGAVLPFASREEAGVERLQESDFLPDAGHTHFYTRDEQGVTYTHYFGLNHALDFSVRRTVYQYAVPDTIPEYGSIDRYEEYRMRYTFPVYRDQVLAVRYTVRPTRLQLTQETFAAQKLELELNSRWAERFSTQLGAGWLRDLDMDATTVSHLADRGLLKAGLQWDITSKLSLGAKYLANPELDLATNASGIVEGSYTFTDTWSMLGRYRIDDYKRGAEQTGYYLAVRFEPDSNWWSEFGVKHAERGSVSGNYGLASIIYRF